MSSLDTREGIQFALTMGVDDFQLHLLSEGVSPRTTAQFLYRIQIIFKSCKPLNEENYRRFLVSLLQNGKSESCVNKYTQTIRRYGGFCGWDWVTKIKKIREHTKTKHVLSVDQLTAFFSAGTENDNYHSEHDKYNLFWRLVAMTGARAGEIRVLKKSDIDTSSRLLFINRTKTFEGRIVPYHSSLNEFIIPYLEKLETDLLFPTRYKNTPISHASLTKDFNQRKKSIGITTPITPHSLRHSFITRMLIDAKAPIPVIQGIVGHKKLDTTAQYTHNNIYAMRDAIKRDPMIIDSTTPEERIELVIEYTRELLGKDPKIDKEKLNEAIAKLYDAIKK